MFKNGKQVLTAWDLRVNELLILRGRLAIEARGDTVKRSVLKTVCHRMGTPKTRDAYEALQKFDTWLKKQGIEVPA